METNTKEYTPKAFPQFKILDVVLLVFFCPVFSYWQLQSIYLIMLLDWDI